LTLALDNLSDQAAGLRRMLQPALPGIVAFCSAPGAGRSALCASFAAALAHAGRRVLVLDCAGAGAGSLLGAPRRPDLLEGARAGLGPGELIAQAGPAVAVVRAERALRELAQVSERDRDRVARALEAVRRESDCVLVDTPGDARVLAAGCSDVLLVMRPDTEGVLAAYRVLKRTAPMLAGQPVQVLANRVAPGARPRRFFGNLSATARQFLGMSLAFAGEIPEDECFQRASSLKQPVVEVFPGSAAARAVRGCAFGLLRRDRPEALGAEAFVRRLTAAARTIAAQRVPA
jgi:flagellar biosynthesis protein FlhG